MTHCNKSNRTLLGFILFVVVVGSPFRVLADYPIASHRYLADPGSLVHEGRVYLYCSNDDDSPLNGDYAMKSIVCVSSSDLKNWTDHGEVFRVPVNAAWAAHSWAPAVIARNGQFYLYFGNNASGIGVASCTSPAGTFTDAKGGSLVSASTPGASGTNMWLFDPAVFIDDDNQAYLYFGGNGADNARVIRLNSDMVSVSSSAIAMTVPNFFEASWVHKRNGVYYFSYSTTPSAGLRIDYLTSSSPTAGFVYGGIAAGQPPSNNNNNHHAIFLFNGSWYHAYHNRDVATQAGIATTYRRNLGLERLDHNPDGTIQQVSYTTNGLSQLAFVNPFVRNEAESFNAQSGIETEVCSEGGMDVGGVTNGSWIKIAGVDFGSAGAATLDVRAASAASGGTIELRLDDRNSGTLLGTASVAGTGGWQTWTTVSCPVSGATGVHDLYLKVTGGGGPLLSLNWWQFVAPPATVAPTITAQPASQAVNGGASVTFTAAASGSPTPTYQWKKDGTEIPGATQATYAIASTQIADQGSYTCDATNAAGSATTAAATLTLAVPATFDVAGYFARNSDVAAAFAGDNLGAWMHFWNYGLAEGRQYDAQFIVGEYLLLNTDLTNAFGSDQQAALMHWLTYGKPVEDRSGRVPIGFNVDSYLARYPDLAAAFGSITPTALRNVTVWNHYLDWGVTEARSDGDFEAYNYLATNADLSAVFGTDVQAAALHWYFYGRREGRRLPANFDVTGYRTRNPDIVTVWGNDRYGCWLHYRDTGVYEGRTYDDLFRVLEYRARYADVQAAYGTDLTGVLLHWLFYGKSEGRLGRNP